MDKNIIVFYHGNCRDGFTAAWAAWKKFGDSAEYIPLIWSNLMTDQIPSVKDKEVYFLDFTPTEEELDRIVKDNASVRIIDHHISKEKLVKSMPGSVYDVNHSGAVLSWQYFHPEKPMPQICLYAEDYDLWNWKIPGSAEVLSYIDLKGEFKFDVWEKISDDLEDINIRKEYEAKGRTIAEFIKKVASEVIDQQATLVDCEGYEVYAVNCPRFLKDAVGNQLATIKPPFGIVWSYTTHEMSISMRALPGTFDLIPLAGKFGGGGHKGAANFRLPFGSPLPWKILDKKKNEK